MHLLKCLDKKSHSLFYVNGFVISLIALLSIFLINFILKNSFPSYVPMSLFLGSVVIAAWLGGGRIGLITMFLGAAFEILFFSDSLFSFFTNMTDLVRLFVYLVQGILISFIFGKLHQYQIQVIVNENQLAQAFANEKHARMLAEKSLKTLEKNQGELKKEREVAKNANNVKSLFLAHMSHEIRTPLVSIIGFADLLKDSSLSEEKRLNYAEIIERTGNNLKQLINDILDISKVEAGHVDIDPHPFSLQSLFYEVQNIFQIKCEEKKIQLKMIAESKIPSCVTADSTRIKQILINLIGNSIKFTEIGSVTVRYAVEDRQLKISIEDTGIGIADHQAEKLFEDFSQADASIARRFAGTGLGLALSRRLARMLGGDVWLKWSMLGEGSVFDMQIQLDSVSAETVVHSIPSVCALPQCKGKKILVVDDSPDNRLLLESMLGRCGVETSTASNGVEALKAVERLNFDVILMDMQMPVMDGYTAASRLRERQCTTPVIALTANAMKEDRKKCLEAGCDDYLSKPLQKEDLYKLLSTYCVDSFKLAP